jgi:hypothetical protein
MWNQEVLKVDQQKVGGGKKGSDGEEEWNMLHEYV